MPLRIEFQALMMLVLLSAHVSWFGCVVSAELNVSYTQYNFDSPIVDYFWCSNSNESNSTKHLMVLTEMGFVYKSQEKGPTFSKLNDHIFSKGEDSTIAWFIRHPSNHEMIIFVGSKGVNWVTEDCGKTARKLALGKGIIEIDFHPTEEKWIIASSWTKCEDFIETSCEIYKELFVSRDMGEHWNLIASGVIQFSWFPSLEDNEASKRRILLLSQNHGLLKLKGELEYTLSYSDDFFQTSKVLFNRARHFVLSSNFLFVAGVNQEDKQEAMLSASSIKGINAFHFSEIILPFTRLRELSYTVLESESSRVVLNVNHNSDNYLYGNIYVSDSRGVTYSLSLKNNIRNPRGDDFDFYKAKGIDGIYIANSIDEEMLRFHLQSGNKALISSEGKRIRNRKGKEKPTTMKNLQDELKEFVKSYISFNKGGSWNLLAAPTLDSKGHRITCEDESCTLHIQFESMGLTHLQKILSLDEVPGLLIANGNVGTFLSNNPEDINTYISRDGGRTWKELAKGSHAFAAVNSGEEILLFPLNTPSNKFAYTFDDGQHWFEYELSTEPFEILNIVRAEGNDMLLTLVGEKVGEGGSSEGVIVNLNLTNALQGVCNDQALIEDLQAEAPSVTSLCFLGQEYHVRKRDFLSRCNIPLREKIQFSSFIETSTCACQEEDWECDAGFTNISGVCTWNQNFRKGLTPEMSENCVSFYYQSQGYRKVPGSICAEGVDHSPLKMDCPLRFLNVKRNMMLLALVFALIVYLLYLCSSSLMSNLCGWNRRDSKNYFPDGEEKEEEKRLK
eukprot:TRINITY_DN8513_c0_g1_i1.p1 TRINITY_DN8513_c0_g1~~TRINITY_DN8513_c0_g1_i1.p1  ORF type:complete len:788 (-),score=111.71 TRINITY_DN8513_c0_g1_i1:1083-3446(-)